MGRAGRVWRIGRGRWWRPLFAVAAAYVGVSFLGNATLLAVMGYAKLFGPQPLEDDPSFPEIHNFRRVDARLWAGAQATREEYRQLAALGVTLVVDLTDGGGDDPAFLRRLGMGYLNLHVGDGHAADGPGVRLFLGAMKEATGVVYLHCGAGVGRSSALSAAYEAARGRDPSVVEALSIGPLSFEQAWFVLTAESGDPPGNNVVVRMLSRYVIDAPRTAFNWVRHRVERWL